MQRQVTSVDQSDRKVPINLRQSGPTPVQMLISTRIRKSPYWHLSMEAGCWRATVYNRMYHPRGFVKPEDGGAMVEYDTLVNHVTLWNVAVERQIQVVGSDAEAFVNYVVTRDATRIKPMHGKYVILCNQKGGVLNDPVLLEAGENHNLMVIAPAHHRRIAAGILSWGQDMDAETLPFQCNLGYQVPRTKQADYIGKGVLEKVRGQIEAGKPPFKNILVGMTLGGKPIDDYAPDFWMISGGDGGDPVGYVTSPWYSPELETNIAMGYVPWAMRELGTSLKVWLPDQYAETPGEPVDAEVVEIPFRPSVNPSAREIAKNAGRDAAF